MKRITANDPESKSLDTTTENLAELARLFPEAFTEGKVDFSVLRELLGDALDETEEKYGLHWHGKRRARRLALTPSTGTLRPCPDESVAWDSTQHLMIGAGLLRGIRNDGSCRHGAEYRGRRQAPLHPGAAPGANRQGGQRNEDGDGLSGPHSSAPGRGHRIGPTWPNRWSTHLDHIKPDRSEDDLFCELLLKLGYDLCAPVERRELAGKRVNAVAGGALVTCLAESIKGPDVDETALGIVAWRTEMDGAQDVTVVFRDSAFEDEVAKANMTELLRQHDIKDVRSL